MEVVKSLTIATGLVGVTYFSFKKVHPAVASAVGVASYFGLAMLLPNCPAMTPEEFGQFLS